MSTPTLTFFDNFSSLSLWNGSSGTWDTNYWYNPLTGNGGSLPSNGEQEWYINANDPATSAIKPWAASNGILTITGAAAPSSIQSQINNYQYTSGELNTYHSFSQTYGYFEMRAELPAGQGLWPAFWMLPENGSWPPEIDIMEQLGNAPGTIYTSVHSGTSSAEVNAGGSTSVSSNTGYHNYAVSWTPTTLTFYVDGHQVYQTATPAGMNVPMYLELNLAMGGGWPGNVDSTTPLPAQMHVAYVDAYSANPYPSSAPTTTFTANGTAGQVLLGAAGYQNIFNAGTNSVIMTGDGETNTYVYSALPTAAGQITDFNPALDTINLSGLLTSVGYTGSNPFGDGTLSLVSDGHGGTDVVYKAAASSTPTTIVDLDNIAVSALSTSADFIVAGATPPPPTTPPPTPPPTTPPPTTPPPSSGITLTGNDTPGQVLMGTTGNDTFYAGHNSVVMTGDGGSDTFVFNYQPWNAGQITDFNPATDTVNVSGLLAAAGYHGTNPFADGTLTLSSDGKGGTEVYYHPPSSGTHHVWPIKIVDLDHVAPSAINTSKDFITGTTTPPTTPPPTTPPPTTPPPTTGITLTGNDTAGQVLMGTSGNDTFNAGHNSVVMTGSGGSDTFVFNYLPWNAGQITDFNPATDTINVAGFLSAAGYHGTSPFTDGTLSLSSDGSGGTNLYYNPPGAGANGIWPIKIVDLDHVSASSLNIASDFIFH